jgi:hypothetical protein
MMLIPQEKYPGASGSATAGLIAGGEASTGTVS